jgi:Zn-dependent M16 (insulinase) family peptidase
MIRDFTGITDDDRLEFRNNILGMTPEILLEDASRYFTSAADSSMVAVYASQDSLEKANKLLEPKLTVETLT